MNKKTSSIAAVLVLLVCGAAWAMGFFGGGDPQVAELERMRDENFGKMEGMSDEERRKQFGDFREKMQGLSEDQRRQFFENSRPMFMQMMNQRMDKFFAKSPEEQNQELDRRIDQMEEWRENRGNNGGARERGGWGNRGNMTPQQQDQRRKERLDRSSPELRGKMDRYRDMMNERREQRGLDPLSGHGMHGGRGGPR